MTDEAKALVEQSETIRSQMYLDLIANDAQHKAMLDLIETQAREIERLREAVEWMENYEPGIIEAIRMRVARAELGEKRDLPECFGSIDATHPQSRAENCCDDCPSESLCRAALAGDSHDQ